MASQHTEELQLLQNKLPKYIKVKAELANQIRKGVYEDNELVPSESELMKQFGVSRFTVRQAVRELVQDGLLRTEQGKGTFVSQSAKTEADSDKIALLSMAINTYIFPEIINGILGSLKGTDYHLILSHTQYSHEQERQELLKLINQHIAGLIVELTLSGKPNPNIDLFLQIKKMGIPLIQIDSKLDELDSPYVILDDEYGGYLAGEYLYNLGHRRTAVIYNSNHLPAVLRMQGFKRAMMERGIVIPPERIKAFEHCGEAILDFSCRLTKELMKTEERPTAIFYFNDEFALEGCRAIWELGLRVPEDVSVIGFDNSDLSNLSKVNLTTLTHPKARLGETAISILMDIIKNGTGNIDQHHQVIIKPELIVRDSCRAI